MFSSKHRLRNDEDVLRAIKSKRSVFDSACGIKYAANHLPESRFAIVVSTKVSKNATDRNKVRRQYREIVKRLLSTLTPGYDIALLVSKTALSLPYAAKAERLERVFAKAGLLPRGSAVANRRHLAGGPVPKNPLV